MEEFSAEGSGVQDMGPQIGGLVVAIQQTVSVLFVRIRKKILDTAVLICVILLLFWIALFLYGSFYYSFMPTANYITPVHFYRTDCPTPHDFMCSFLVANVSLLKNGKDQVMTYAQPYQITLELEMPESPTNQQLGMFLVKMAPYSKSGQILGMSTRSAMLHYRSSLLQALGTVVFSPMLLTGASEQKQTVSVELYSEFKDDSYNPSVGAVIEILSQHIQIYRAHLYIFAHFTGIRYILYHYPLMSALIGVMSNFTFLSLSIILSFLQLNLGFRRLPGKADFVSDMELEERKESDDLNDPTELQAAENPTDPLTPLITENNDIMDSSSVEMEQSIPDMGEDKSEESGELAEEEPISEVREMILRQRHLSAGMSHLSQVLKDTTDKSYFRAGGCLSS